MPKTAFLQCQIKRGEFSGERRFSISLSNGETYESLVSVAYLRTSNFASLDKRFPSGENPSSGYVVALPIKKERTEMVVEVPDGALVSVSRKALKGRGVGKHVSVGS